MTERACAQCGKSYHPKSAQQKYCRAACRYTKNYTDVGGVDERALRFGANILMPRGKRDMLRKMVGEALGSACTYCGEVLTLESMSLDHKTPYGDRSTRRNKKANREVRLRMDAPENLHICCRRCNQAKGDFDDDQFRRLLALFKEDPAAKKILLARLGRAAGFAKNFR